MDLEKQSSTLSNDPMLASSFDVSIESYGAQEEVEASETCNNFTLEIEMAALKSSEDEFSGEFNFTKQGEMEGSPEPIEDDGTPTTNRQEETPEPAVKAELMEISTLGFRTKFDSSELFPNAESR